ncbi:MAG: hypothetical protein ACI8XM_000888 [Haloarculaceae archaeon]|jgi:hypothetical protein
MAASRNTGHSIAGTSIVSRLDRLLSLSRYDLVLVGIPLLFAVALATHVAFGVSVRLAVAAGAVTSAVVLVDAIYLNPPTDTGSGQSSH